MGQNHIYVTGNGSDLSNTKFLYISKVLQEI